MRRMGGTGWKPSASVSKVTYTRVTHCSCGLLCDLWDEHHGDLKETQQHCRCSPLFSSASTNMASMRAGLNRLLSPSSCHTREGFNCLRNARVPHPSPLEMSESPRKDEEKCRSYAMFDLNFAYPISFPWNYTELFLVVRRELALEIEDLYLTHGPNTK